MRPAALLAIFLVAGPFAAAQSNFSGVWKLNSALSNLRGLPAPADPFLKVEQTASSLFVSAASQDTGPFTTAIYPLDGSANKRKFEGSDFDTRTKWEGSALMANILVGGTQDYVVMERWTRSRDGSRTHGHSHRTTNIEPGAHEHRTRARWGPTARRGAAGRGACPRNARQRRRESIH